MIRLNDNALSVVKFAKLMCADCGVHIAYIQQPKLDRRQELHIIGTICTDCNLYGYQSTNPSTL